MKIILKELTKNKLFNICKEEILNYISVKELSTKLSLHTGTIKRWILKKEIPLNYFNQINDILGNKYEFLFSEINKYKSLDQFFTPENEAKN